MLNDSFSFPDLAQIVICAHNRYFGSLTPPARPLTHLELKSYRDRFLVGWRTSAEINRNTFYLDVLLDNAIPFSVPRIAIAKGDYVLRWPHVEDKGLLCLHSPNDLITHGLGADLSIHFLKEAVKYINDSIAGNNKEDFVSEFLNYWLYWCVELGRTKEFLLLGHPSPPSRIMHFADIGHRTLICESRNDGHRWTRDHFGKNYKSLEDFTPCTFLWFDKPIYPDQYPKTNAEFSQLVQQMDANQYDLLKTIVPTKPDSIPVLFGFESGNGPALGGILLNEVVERKPKKSKKAYPRFAGFRNGKIPKELSTTRYLKSNAKLSGNLVSRIDREWIFERGGYAQLPKLDNLTVSVIGCGSLGASVANILAHSGIRNFIFIDPDMLEIDNIGRHLLGAQFAGKPKVRALKTYIESHFPGLTNIKPLEQNWENLPADAHTELSSCDLIISTTGDWNGEAALNHTFNTSLFPPIVYGWTEPFARVGHALAINDLGGCLSCGMDRTGIFSYALTSWKDAAHLRREPACGVSYQPYSMMDILPIQAMIARLAMDVLLGKVKKSQHRAYLGQLNCLPEGGSISKDSAAYYGNISMEHRTVEKDWHTNSNCRYQH